MFETVFGEMFCFWLLQSQKSIIDKILNTLKDEMVKACCKYAKTYFALYTNLYSIVLIKIQNKSHTF